MLPMTKVQSAVRVSLADAAERRSSPCARRTLSALTVAAFATLASAAAANAASFTVNSTADAALTNPAATTCVSTHSGACTLRAAVQAADNTGGASTITLPAGDYKLTVASTSADDPANGDLDIKGGSTAITINGAGAAATVIDANHIDRAFAVQAGEGLTLSGVTIERGDSGEGAGRESSKWGEGGAILNEGSLLVEGSRLENNSSIESGGAIFQGYSATSTSIVDSEANGNAADLYGGVILAYGAGTITLTGDTMTGNVSYDNGGAVSAQGSGPLTITGSDISGNAAHKEGGGALGYYDSAALTISHSTLSDDGTGEYTGGAILAYSASSITIEDSTLSGDSAYEAGAMYADGTGPISIQGSTLSDDHSDTDGTVYAGATGRLTVGNSTFDGDAAPAGSCGALCLSVTDLTLSGSSFNHDSSYEGAAIYLKGSSATAEESIAASTFSGNQAIDDSGGAIYDERGNLEVSASTFTGNSAEEGGALTYASGDTLRLVNDTFDGNTASLNGGAINLKQAAEGEAEIVLLNDTIARNTSLAGGGIYKPEFANTIENTIVAGNYGVSGANGGADCYGVAQTDNAGAADRGGNIDSDGTCFNGGVNGDQTNIDALLGPLAANGGLTETDALLPGSPAIGNAVLEPLACPATDERGIARSGLCDIGAYQTVAAPASAPAPVTAGGGAGPTISGAVKAPAVTQFQCRSTRSETIRWRVTAGVHLKRIVVSVNGVVVHRLTGNVRSVTVSMAGRPRGSVSVVIAGVGSDGAHYQMVRTFHLCVPAKTSHQKPGGSYLKRV